MTQLILVRHAMPQMDPGLAARLWGLSESAREDCVLLAHGLSLSTGGIVHSSPEPKARQTADVLALRLGRYVREDAGLAEVDRPDQWVDSHRELAVSYLSGKEIPGWEPVERVRKRFHEAVERASRQPGTGDPIVVASHGMAMTCYVSSIATIDAVEWWRTLTLPDAWELDLETGALRHAWNGGMPPPDA